MINQKAILFTEILRILEHAKKNKIIAEIKKDQPEYADKMIKKGFQLVTIGTDQRFMTAAAKAALEKNAAKNPYR